MNKQEPVNCTNSELSTFLQGLAEGYLPTFSLDTTQCALSKSNPIASKSYQHGKKTVTFHGFPSLMMCKHSTASHGEDSLTLSQEDSHAKTSALLEKEQESKDQEAVCGNTWQESSVRFDLNTHSWKTHQCLWEEDLALSSLTLPKWGMMRNGVLWERITSPLLTEETEYGYMLPTPVCQDCRHAISRSNPQDKQWESNLGEVVARFYPEEVKNGSRMNPVFVEWLMGWTIGWTDLKPLATDKFQQWQQQHGKF
jgi:hypothetical protein